jgi:hypothetical protein
MLEIEQRRLAARLPERLRDRPGVAYPAQREHRGPARAAADEKRIEAKAKAGALHFGMRERREALRGGHVAHERLEGVGAEGQALLRGLEVAAQLVGRG